MCDRVFLIIPIMKNKGVKHLIVLILFYSGVKFKFKFQMSWHKNSIYFLNQKWTREALNI